MGGRQNLPPTDGRCAPRSKRPGARSINARGVEDLHRYAVYHVGPQRAFRKQERAVLQELIVERCIDENRHGLAVGGRQRRATNGKVGIVPAERE